MRDDFLNELDWFTITAAFTIWSVHFMLGWTVSVVFPGQSIVLWLGVAATIAALALLAWLWRARRVSSLRSVPGLAIGFATLGTIFDSMPALMA